MNAEQRLDYRERRRLQAEARFLDRIDRLEEAADRMVGELSSGRCYVYPVGGKYREGTRADLIAFLIRNKYVR